VPSELTVPAVFIDSMISFIGNGSFRPGDYGIERVLSNNLKHDNQQSESLLVHDPAQAITILMLCLETGAGLRFCGQSL